MTFPEIGLLVATATIYFLVVVFLYRFQGRRLGFEEPKPEVLLSSLREGDEQRRPRPSQPDAGDGKGRGQEEGSSTYDFNSQGNTLGEF